MSRRIRHRFKRDEVRDSLLLNQAERRVHLRLGEVREVLRVGGLPAHALRCALDLDQSARFRGMVNSFGGHGVLPRSSQRAMLFAWMTLRC